MAEEQLTDSERERYPGVDSVFRDERDFALAAVREERKHLRDLACVKPLVEEQFTPEWYTAGPVHFAAFGDRLLILEDAFKSGYECRACEGKGTIRCDQCGGFGSYTRNGNDIKCSQCSGTGKLRCGDCDGKGGLLVVPEQSQRRPSTGRVVSTGDKVKYFHAGDDVLYSNFAGHAMDLPLETGQVCLRILHESEILAQVKGHLELRAVRHQREAIGV